MGPFMSEHLAMRLIFTHLTLFFLLTLNAYRPITSKCAFVFADAKIALDDVQV